ncbi:MAG: amidohydrolase [Treponema sp.]|jgi:predicted amidohydrolase YtcJ|nr:amidohydrolase [Treponema sp.]
MGTKLHKVIFNAKVYLRRETFTEAVLIEGERIAAVGTNEDILRIMPGETQLIDARGGVLLPGFQDCHVHLYYLGQKAKTLNAAGVSSIDELIERGRRLLEELKPPPGAFITGWGLNQNDFANTKRYPTRYDLDRISREHPIMVSRVCGHIIYCNSKALETAGITASTKAIEGGRIDIDETGTPTGRLTENAAALVRRIVPVPTDSEMQAVLEWSMNHALSRGITGVGSYDTGGADFQQLVTVYRRIYRNGGSRLRISMQCGIAGDEKQLDAYIRRNLSTGLPLYPPYLKTGPLKLFADGSLGSHTAWLRRPYRDNPETTGVSVIKPAALANLIKKADAQGLQVAVHAIGDAGIEAVLSALETVTGEHHNPLRHGVLHCQITDRILLERMAKNDILALVQPIFLAEDMHIVEHRVGRELASTSYAWATMERLGIRTAYGTDCPVASINPLAGIACAVTRQDRDGFPQAGFFPQERVDVYTAVDNYTIGTAYGNFDENRLGRILPGYLADLVLLDRDIFSIPAQEIPSAQVVITLVSGEIVYTRDV